jgi:hypothetical protein
MIDLYTLRLQNLRDKFELYDGKIYGTEGVDIWDKGNRIKKREPLSLHDEFTNGKRDGDFLALRLKTTCHILF